MTTFSWITKLYLTLSLTMSLTMSLTVDTMDEMPHTPPAHQIAMPDAPRLRRSSNEPNYMVEPQDGTLLTYSPTSPTSNPIDNWEQERMHACMEWDRQQASTPSISSEPANSSYVTALKQGIDETKEEEATEEATEAMPKEKEEVATSNVVVSSAVHIQRDRTDSGRRITTTYEFPNCLYVSNLPEGITEAELADLCHQTLVCRVDHVHMTRTKSEGHLIAFVYLVYWELDKLPNNMYNRLAEFKYVNFYYHPMGLPASTRLPPIRVQLARNKSQLHKIHQDKQQKHI